MACEIEFTKRGGYGVERELRHTMNTRAVFWGHLGNSYVVVEEDQGLLRSECGKSCNLLCINGIGEIRWHIMRHDLYNYKLHGEDSGDHTLEFIAAMKYWGLKEAH